ncbi:hypothetical protein [uncultured Ruegeria sp.]|uniref:hypothetical protein n=1 Tax=uncultured Ruegeria sp. TaxID=259304 RepID=UPI00263392C7|nr:hypothetical protein [uncultured Ruegeria sp.]
MIEPIAQHLSKLEMSSTIAKLASIFANRPDLRGRGYLKPAFQADISLFDRIYMANNTIAKSPQRHASLML